MIAEWIKDIPNWEQEYKQMMKEESRLIPKRQLELLDGDEIRSYEGMIYGQMYADWKKKKGLQ
tara:strand:+ start:453 stop:641 length:189 start_codon:yes stop_codon:yes gene_type:complete